MLKDNKELIKNLFSVKNIIIYVLAFMVSMVGMGQDVSPFSIAMVGACLSSKVPAIILKNMCLEICICSSLYSSFSFGGFMHIVINSIKIINM